MNKVENDIMNFAEVEHIYQDEITRLTRQVQQLQKELSTLNAAQKQRPALPTNCSSLLVNDGRVRECVSGNVIGVLPADDGARGVALKAQRRKSQETPAERASSFQKVFDTRAWGHSWEAQCKAMNASGMIAKY
jgi:hypothetical protein